MSALLAAFAFLSFSQLWHYPPVASFHHQWFAWESAAALLLAASILRLHLNGSSSVFSRITLSGILLSTLACLTFLQAWLDMLAYAHVALILFAVVLVAVGLSSFAAALRELGQSGPAAAAFSAGLLAAALVNVFAAGLQSRGLFINGLSLVELPPPVRLDGLLGQANHFGVLCVIGMTSVWLWWQRTSSWGPLWLTALVLLTLGLAGSGSRSGLVAMAFGWTYLFIAELRRKSPRKMIGLALGACAIIATFWLYELVRPVSTESALRATGASERFELYEAAFDLLTDLPILGIGFGEFAWMRILGSDAELRSLNSSHTHNVFLQLAVEWGVVGILVGSVFAAHWLQLAVTALKKGTAAEIFAVVVTGSIGIHSMFEYPLWHTYYLLIFVFLVGLAGEKSFHLRSDPTTQRAKPLLWGSLCIAGAIAAADYLRTQAITLDAVRQEMSGAKTIAFPRTQINDIASLTLFQGEADINLVRTFELDPLFLDMKFSTVEQSARYRPTPETIARLILYLAYVGHDERAIALLSRLKAGEDHYRAVKTMLLNYSVRHPGVLDAVLRAE